MVAAEGDGSYGFNCRPIKHIGDTPTSNQNNSVTFDRILDRTYIDDLLQTCH